MEFPLLDRVCFLTDTVDTLAVLGKSKAKVSEILKTSKKIHSIFNRLNPVDEETLQGFDCEGLVYDAIDKTLTIESAILIEKLEEIHSALPDGLIRLARGDDQ